MFFHQCLLEKTDIPKAAIGLESSYGYDFFIQVFNDPGIVVLRSCS